ncbi:hypothetical protein ACTXT7_014473 [Hymenolepis weldensis]
MDVKHGYESGSTKTVYMSHSSKDAHEDISAEHCLFRIEIVNVDKCRFASEFNREPIQHELTPKSSSKLRSNRIRRRNPHY